MSMLPGGNVILTADVPAIGATHMGCLSALASRTRHGLHEGADRGAALHGGAEGQQPLPAAQLDGRDEGVLPPGSDDGAWGRLCFKTRGGHHHGGDQAAALQRLAHHLRRQEQACARILRRVCSSLERLLQCDDRHSSGPLSECRPLSTVQLGGTAPLRQPPYPAAVKSAAR